MSCDLHRGDADLRSDLQKGVASLDRGHSRPYEYRVIGIEIHPGPRIRRLESLRQSLFGCADGGKIGGRERQLLVRLLRTSTSARVDRRLSTGQEMFACASVRECPLTPPAQAMVAVGHVCDELGLPV